MTGKKELQGMRRDAIVV